MFKTKQSINMCKECDAETTSCVQRTMGIKWHIYTSPKVVHRSNYISHEPIFYWIELSARLETMWTSEVRRTSQLRFRGKWKVSRSFKPGCVKKKEEEPGMQNMPNAFVDSEYFYIVLRIWILSFPYFVYIELVYPHHISGNCKVSKKPSASSS